MSIEQTLTALKARAFTKGVLAVSKEVGVSDDTMRRILSDKKPPGWLKTALRMEKVATDV